MLHPPHLTEDMVPRNFLIMHLNFASFLPLYMDRINIAMPFACQCKSHGDQDTLHSCIAQIVH